MKATSLLHGHEVALYTCHKQAVSLLSSNSDVVVQCLHVPGTPAFEIVTNTVAFATKISGEVANLQVVFTFALSKQKC